MKYKINPDAVYREINGVYYVLLPRDKTIHRFTDVGSLIWRLIDKNFSESEIIKEVVNQYDVEEEVVLNDLENFIKELVEKKILLKIE
ncbi:MAG: hypothetical protein DRH51_05650 [Candidatus Coatesbacteria bacterium]|nr:MAG: hypothetical protein DRH51_05650 [Candidatus Coatesbacteria bacterium]RLC41752.1 MAG: hypothetical protein DRH49_04915 [Candidatus Coatesbacteria bacterium]RLC43987.1 MAG: hypothetical protein DRH44_03785 [Candidatus Coatesbacteria bacterium]